MCRELDSHRLLIHLIPLFADKELPVRVDAVRAVVQVGSDSAALLLRLRAEFASDEPELLGSCYSGVLALDGRTAIPWAAKFLSPEDDLPKCGVFRPNHIVCCGSLQRVAGPSTCNRPIAGHGFRGVASIRQALPKTIRRRRHPCGLTEPLR